MGEYPGKITARLLFKTATQPVCPGKKELHTLSQCTVKTPALPSYTYPRTFRKHISQVFADCLKCIRLCKQRALGNYQLYTELYMKLCLPLTTNEM